MANFLTTLNMNLVLPIPTVDPGPDWANNINKSLQIIDGHDHTTGKGLPIVASAININSDLNFNLDFNAINLRTVRFVNNVNPAPLDPLVSPLDIGCIYEAGADGDLYYNTGAGVQVQITKNGGISGTPGSINGLPSPGASVNFQPDPIGTYKFERGTNVAANLDAATLIIRYPGAIAGYPVPVGIAINLQAPTNLTGSYSLTLPLSLPGQISVLTVGPSGLMGTNTFDEVGQAMTSVGANAIAATMTSTGANAIANSRTRTVNVLPAIQVPAGGIALSGNGVLQTSSNSYQDGTNLTVILTTTGRPIRISLVPSPLQVGSLSGPSRLEMQNNNSGLGAFGTFSIVRQDSPSGLNFVRLSEASFGTNSFTDVMSMPPESIAIIDNVAAGTYSYRIQASVTAPNGTIGIIGCRLVAYEL